MRGLCGVLSKTQPLKEGCVRLISMNFLRYCTYDTRTQVGVQVICLLGFYFSDVDLLSLFSPMTYPRSSRSISSDTCHLRHGKMPSCTCPMLNRWTLFSMSGIFRITSWAVSRIAGENMTFLVKPHGSGEQIPTFFTPIGALFVELHDPTCSDGFYPYQLYLKYDHDEVDVLGWVFILQSSNHYQSIRLVVPVRSRLLTSQ